MSLNSNALNASSLNSAFYGATGSGSLISLEQSVIQVASGALINFEQYVALIGSGSIINVEQDVELRIVGSGAIVDIGQEVLTIASGALINIAQKIPTVAEVSFFNRNGWDLVVSLGGFNVPRGTIQGVKVVHGINDDSRAEVMLNPGAASYNLYSYQGKELIISARTGTDYERIFTGVVDIPRVEVVNEKIILEGVSSRETLIRSYLTPYVAGIGSYSETVFGPRNNVFKEVNDRMTTTPHDLDFDPNNNWTVTSWTPKASPDFTLGNSDLYREQQPQVRIESAREIVNKVSISVRYAYQRLHQTGISYTWNSGLGACDFLTKGNTLPTRDMIRNAAAGAGWKVGAISFTDVWGSGFYYCSGTAIGWVNTQKVVNLTASTATDSSGNPYTQSQIVGSTSLGDVLALGATWTAKKRFSQNVQESYTLTVNSPQSQSLYGVREQNNNYALQADYDPKQWEDESLYDTEFDGTKVSANSTTYYINKDTENAEFSLAMTTALNKAKTDILRAHRDTEVSYKTFINPTLQLRHTVYLNTTRINTKGKVRSITHEFSPDGEATTSVRLALYRSIGSQAESTLSVPSRPTFETPSTISAATLQTRWGLNPNTTAARNWNGYVGNKWIIVGSGFNTNTFKTNYPESFTVDSPSIPSEKRDQKSYSSSSSYNISIPNDTFTVTFVDS